MLAVCALLVGVPAAHAESTQPTGTTLTHGDPGRGMPSRLHQARRATLAAYRDARRAAHRAGVAMHGRERIIRRTSSMARLRRTRSALIRREHRYQRIVRRRRLAVRAAVHQRGTRYSWGGASPAGFDCSGLVMWAYGHAGVELPHSSYAQMRVGRRVPRAAIRPGDLVFSEGGGHVGIYIGHGLVVHAPHPGTVVQLARLRTWAVVEFRRVIR
jgi:cell wall-associated NlpC family hydrolase